MRRNNIIILLSALIILIVLLTVAYLLTRNSHTTNIYTTMPGTILNGDQKSTFDNINASVSHSGSLETGGTFKITINNLKKDNINYLVVIEITDNDKNVVNYYTKTLCAKSNDKTSITIDHDKIENGSYKPYLIVIGDCN